MVFLDHYSNYPYSHLVRVTSDNETFQSKEVYKHLAVTHSISIYFYNEYHERSLDTLFKVSSKYFGKRIIYCGLVSHNQNTIVECRIKEFILGRRCTLLIHTTILWLEALSTMTCTLSFKVLCQRYNSLDMG